MEYQKIINLLDNTLNQPSKFKTKNRIKINDESHGVYNIHSQIKFKTSIFRSILCDYSDAYIHLSGTIKKIMSLSKCAVCDSKKSKFIKEQETSGLIRGLGIKTPLSKIPLLGPLLSSRC